MMMMILFKGMKNLEIEGVYLNMDVGSGEERKNLVLMIKIER